MFDFQLSAGELSALARYTIDQKLLASFGCVRDVYESFRGRRELLSIIYFAVQPGYGNRTVG